MRKSKVAALEEKLLRLAAAERVATHTRRTKSGKVVQVKAHTRKGELPSGPISKMPERLLSEAKKSGWGKQRITSMSRAQAAEWVKGSAYTKPVFHITQSMEAAEAIAKGGFRIDLDSKQGLMYGRGVYFNDDAKRNLGYAKRASLFFEDDDTAQIEAYVKVDKLLKVKASFKYLWPDADGEPTNLVSNYELINKNDPEVMSLIALAVMRYKEAWKPGGVGGSLEDHFLKTARDEGYGAILYEMPVSDDAMGGSQMVVTDPSSIVVTAIRPVKGGKKVVPGEWHEQSESSVDESTTPVAIPAQKTADPKPATPKPVVKGTPFQGWGVASNTPKTAAKPTVAKPKVATAAAPKAAATSKPTAKPKATADTPMPWTPFYNRYDMGGGMEAEWDGEQYVVRLKGKKYATYSYDEWKQKLANSNGLIKPAAGAFRRPILKPYQGPLKPYQGPL